MLANANNNEGPAPVYQPPGLGMPLTEETGVEILEAVRTMNRTMETLQQTLQNWEEAAAIQQQWIVPSMPPGSSSSGA